MFALYTTCTYLVTVCPPHSWTHKKSMDGFVTNTCYPRFNVKVELPLLSYNHQTNHNVKVTVFAIYEARRSQGYKVKGANYKVKSLSKINIIW